MTVDVATLVFDFRSESAAQAEKAMDRLIAKGDQLDVTAKKVRRATDFVNEGHRGAAQSADGAARSATALAAAEGAVEKATRGAAQASAATRQARQLEAAAMREVVVAYNQAERAAKAQAQSVAALRASVDPLAGALDRVNAELAEATRLYKAGAISAVEYERATSVLNGRMMALSGAHGQATKTSRQLTLAGLDLSRQFADIGVTAAMGMNPLMILIQQGPQIADRLAMMRMEGLKLSAVLGGMTAAAAPVLAVLWPIALAVGAVAAAFAIATQQINEGNKDIAKGLGLTAEQMKKVKNDSVTMGDTIKATFQVAGAALWDVFGGTLTAIGKSIKDWYDELIRNTVLEIKAIVGGFVGAYEAIKAVWSLLPRAMSDIGIQTANFLINAVETMVNKSIAGLNKLIAFANAGAKAVGIDAQMQTMGGVDFGRIQNWDAGAAAKAGEVASAAFAGGVKKGGQMVDAAFGAITRQAVKNAEARIRKEAGKATEGPKGPATPRDQTDERTAQIAGMLAQAMQDELQARLAITREARDRAWIERQLAAAALVEKQAQVDRQIANIEDDKGLSAAKKRELTDQLLIVQAMNGRTAAIRETAITEAMNAQLAREAGERARSAIENQIDLLGAQADLTQSAYARALIEVDILKAQQQIERLKLEEVIASATSTATEKAIAQARLNTLGAVQALELKLAQRQTRLVDAIGEAVGAVRGFKDAFRRHDWAGVFDELQRTIQTIQASFAQNGMMGGVVTAGSAAAALIGGKGGRAVGTGLGIAGLGMSAGAYLGGAGGAAMAGGIGGMLGGGALGAGVANGMMALAPVLGPLALAAGALYAAAKIFNLGGKPTNAGAGYDLRTGAMSGNKRTEETEGAARSAGEAIQGIMDAVKAAGIGLTDAVTGLVIGTRDQTQIYLASGQTLKSAVGDSGAAVDTAMRALLASATYVSDAQKKLVDSALAAGKGFDAVAEVLAKYEAAQGITGALADQILQLTDPKAYDVQGVKRDIEAQRKAYQQLATDGFITADLLATINGQLSTLEGLKLAEVLSRYGAAASAANDNADLIEKAKSDVLDAYESFASAKQAEIDALRQTEAGLKAFRRELDFGAIAGRSPISQLAATRREFERLNAMDASNPERMANLQAVGTAFVEASRAASPTELAFQRDLAMVRRATEASGMAAGQQADIAQAQLNTATAQLTALGLLNTTTLDLATTLKTYLALTGQGGGAANDNAIDAARYLAGNKDLGRYATANGLDPLAFAAQHYKTTGQYEIAAGLRHFATGGEFEVGGSGGTDSQLVQFMASPNETVSVRTPSQRGMGGDTSRLETLVENLTATVASQAAELRRIAVSTDQTQSKLKDFEGNGMFVRGRGPDDPVDVAA